jgi:hypothetical protein
MTLQSNKNTASTIKSKNKTAGILWSSETVCVCKTTESSHTKYNHKASTEMLNRNEYTSLEAAQWNRSCNNELQCSDGYTASRQHSPQLMSHPNTHTCNYSLTHMKPTYHRTHYLLYKCRSANQWSTGSFLKSWVISLTNKLFTFYGSQQICSVFGKSLQLVHTFTWYFLEHQF